MKDTSGLQIDVRCFKCGRLPASEITLFEMQNHLYICNICRQQAEQGGKQIRWVGGTQQTALATNGASGSAVAAKPTSALLPPNSLFAVLGMPLTAPIGEIEAAIAQHMKLLLREEDSPERTQRIEQLHAWQEQVDDPATFEAYRERLKPRRPTGQALSVGGRLVYTAEEFLDACESSREGWADGERYLRMGQLQHWVVFQLENRELAGKIRFYQNAKERSNFQALNEVLYCMVQERPFRFYGQEDKWQSLDSIASAHTPAELARQCDIDWASGEHHLYNGSLGYWLEVSQGIRGLSDYYKQAVQSYRAAGQDRGVGLELLLERALPSLPKPNLVVAFDGTEDRYTLERWDRELFHQPIAVTVTNTTRGFTSVDLQLEAAPSSASPAWILFSSVHRAGTPGDGTMPATERLYLANLPLLKRGRRYRRMLKMTVAGANRQPQSVKTFPITFSTQHFFQGMRGILWRWGLRGGLVSFAWNFVVGTLFAWLLVRLSTLIPVPHLPQYYSFTSSSNNVLQILLAGIVDLFQHTWGFFYPYDRWPLANAFPLVVGASIGLIGLLVGYGKGHQNYNERQGAKAFRRWAFWLMLIYIVALIYLNRGFDRINYTFEGAANTLYTLYSDGGPIVVGILIFIIACIIAFIRTRMERYLRKRYHLLLEPEGREK